MSTSTKNKKITAQQDFEERIKKFYAQRAATLKSLQLEHRNIINFPAGKQMSLLCKLAIWFLNTRQGSIGDRFTNLKK